MDNNANSAIRRYQALLETETKLDKLEKQRNDMNERLYEELESKVEKVEEQQQKTATSLQTLQEEVIQNLKLEKSALLAGSHDDDDDDTDLMEDAPKVNEVLDGLQQQIREMVSTLNAPTAVDHTPMNIVLKTMNTNLHTLQWLEQKADEVQETVGSDWGA